MERSLRVLRQEYTDTLTSMDNLAVSLSKQGKYKEAEMNRHRGKGAAKT